MRILSFGEVLLDNIEGALFLGGAPVNFAVNCKNLGLNAQLYSAIGTDENGAFIKKALSEYGLGLELVAELQEYKSGVVEVKMDHGEPSYDIQENVAFDFIDSSAFRKGLTNQEYDLFYFGTLAQRNNQSREALLEILKEGRFKERFFDCNLRQAYYDAEVLRVSLNFATIFKANQSELNEITRLFYGTQDYPLEKACQKLSEEFSIPTIIITAGAEGAYLYQANTFKFIPSVRVELLDAVGAGDAFSAAFATNFIAGKDPTECVVKAHVLGRLVAQQKGALPKISDNLRKKIGISGH